jgi:hypothetical protein
MNGSFSRSPVTSNIRWTGSGPGMITSRLFCAAERRVSSIAACNPVESMNPT